jgi:hypothetical protein
MTSRSAPSTSRTGSGPVAAQPAAQHVVVRGHNGGGHQLDAQRGGLGRVGHPAGDELAEQPLVPGHAGDLAVAKRGHVARQLVAATGQITVVDVVQQDQADRVGDRRQRVLVAATTVGNEIAGRLAVKTNSGVLTDAVDVTADSDGAPVTE